MNIFLNDLLEKIRFTLEHKHTSRWESPYIRHKDIDISGFREKFGISQSELAEILDVNENIINAWETGISKPDKSISLLLRIAERWPDHFLEVLWNY